MNEDRARQTANLLMAATALGAAVFVLRNPKLRRMAWQFARQYASGPLGAAVASTVRSAWDASAPVSGGELQRSTDASAPAPAPLNAEEQGRLNIAR
jgi:hypothetical protein